MNIYTDFFHILNNDRYHMRLLMSESEHLSSRYSCTVKITTSEEYIYIYAKFFFSSAIIMHTLYMHAFSPYHFTGNCFNSWISCKLHSTSYKKKDAINYLGFSDWGLKRRYGDELS